MMRSSENKLPKDPIFPYNVIKLIGSCFGAALAITTTDLLEFAPERCRPAHKLGDVVMRVMVTLIVSWLVAASQLIYAQGNFQLLGVARSEFARQNYDSSILNLKKYLRSFPQDYEAWNLLGASYFLAGQPKRALMTLQRVARYTQTPSFNYLYQSLCYEVLDYASTAQSYLEYTARFNDEHGAKAAFELGVFYYKAKDGVRAKYWLSSYLQRSPPNASHRAKAVELLNLVGTANYSSNPAGLEKPDLELAAYRYSNLSLYNYPHFWWTQIGGRNDQTDGWSPNNPPPGSIVKSGEASYSLLTAAGVGVGPVREGTMTAWAGYNYRQNWITDDYILENWLGDPTDLSSFPIRADLLDRRHQFYGDIRKQFRGVFFLGVFGRFEFERLGSKYFLSPEGDDLKVVLSLKDTTLLIPWAGVAFTDDIRTLFYFYMRKEINNSSPEHSNMTYDITGSTGQQKMSYGLSHAMDFPSIGLETSTELFNYNFIYNDYWLDYSRMGVIVGLDLQILPGLFITGLGGYYEDKYILPRFKTGSCDSTIATGDDSGQNPASGSDSVNICFRADSGTLMQGGLYWNYSQALRIGGSFLQVDNGSKMREFSASRRTIEANVTWAFPSVKRVTRIVDRFADSAFTKESEQ